MCARIFSNNGTQTKGAVISEYQALEHIVVVCELLLYLCSSPPVFHIFGAAAGHTSCQLFPLSGCSSSLLSAWGPEAKSVPTLSARASLALLWIWMTWPFPWPRPELPGPKPRPAAVGGTAVCLRGAGVCPFPGGLSRATLLGSPARSGGKLGTEFHSVEPGTDLSDSVCSWLCAPGQVTQPL